MRDRRSHAGQDADRARRQAARDLAVEALTFLAAEPERLGGFLASAGIGPDQIRAAANEPGFLGGVLDYVTADQRLLLAFADAARVRPQQVVEAAAALGGGPWERDLP